MLVAKNKVKNMENKKFNIQDYTTLDDCISLIEELAEGDPEGFREWKRTNEEDAIVGSHHTLGTFLRNELELWHNGPAVKWFNDRGIYHADDISGIILTSAHRKFNNEEIKLAEQIKEYRDYWEEVNPKVNEGKME